MPWPTPRANESEDEFISRCMADEYIQEDLDDQEQRLAVCYRQWRNRGKSEVSIMEKQYKTFSGLVELKEDKPGAFVARIATLNTVDKDGDVTLPKAFPEGKKILISSYMHGSWMGGLPVGKGTIHERGDEVVVEGQFNLKSDTGKEHYETVKFAPELQEWSYGFIALEKEEDTEWEGQPVARILKKLDVFEASPVLRGAGVDTAVLAIKAESKGPITYQGAHPDGTPKADEGEDWDAGDEVRRADVEELKAMCAWVDPADSENKTAYKLPHHKAAGEHAVVWKGVSGAMAALLGARGGVDIPEGDRKGVYSHLKRHYAEFEKEPPEFRASAEGVTFAVQAEAALAAVNDLVTRAKSLADLRRKEGRALSTANRERISGLLTALKDVAADLQGLLEAAEPDSGKAQRLYLEFIKIKNEMGGMLQCQN